MYQVILKSIKLLSAKEKQHNIFVVFTENINNDHSSEETHDMALKRITD